MRALLLFAVLAIQGIAQENTDLSYWLWRTQVDQMIRDASRDEYERGREKAGLSMTPEKLQALEFEKLMVEAHDAWSEWIKARSASENTTDIRRMNTEAKKFNEMVKAMNRLSVAAGRPVPVGK